MSVKYPILDENFYTNMFAQCNDDEDRGIVFILSESGMHPKSLCNLNEKSLIREGKKHYLVWKRPKTNKILRIPIRKEKIPLVKKFLLIRRKTRQQYDNILKKVGNRAGFDKVSAMTFRHVYCIRLLTDDFTIWEVPHLIGTTLDVAMRNYVVVKREGVDLNKFKYKTLQ